MIKFLFKLVGFVFFIYALVMSVVLNFNLGIIACFLIGIFFLALGLLGKVLRNFKFIIKLGFVCIFLASIFSVFLYVYGQNDNVTYKEDAIIILGAGISGELVTYPLAQRLKGGIEYHKKNPNALIIVTGGQGPQEDITEALAMERYLIANGVNPSKIIKEEKATSTYENFVFSKDILDSKLGSNYTVGFITTDFHIYRASKVAESVGYEATHLNSRSQNFSIPVNYLREVMAVIKYYIFDI